MKKHLSLIGRIFLSAFFIFKGLINVLSFAQFWHRIDLLGIPLAPLVAMLVVFIELGGGIAILVGFYTRFFSPLMALYLFIATLVVYPFWSDLGHFEDFIRNIAIIGGLIIEDFAGAGPESVDDSHYFDV